MTSLLLVEDDDNDVVFLKRALAAAGADFKLEVARDGRQAIETLSDVGSEPTHALLDLKLPEKSGFEVLEWIRAQPRLGGLHVAILTSSNEESDIRRSRELDAECYFVKPMSFALLLEVARKIDRWIRSGERCSPSSV